MHAVETDSLALRVGRADSGEGPGGSLAAALAPGPNPWGVGAVLAVFPTGDELLLPALRGAIETRLRQPRPEPGGAFADLLPSLIAGLEQETGAPVAAGCTLALVRDRQYLVRIGRAPAYLLREGELRLLAQPRTTGSATAAGTLQDGEALVAGTEGLFLALRSDEACGALQGCHTPANAAARLVELARERGVARAAAAVLYAGVGPALAGRIRSVTAEIAEARWGTPVPSAAPEVAQTPRWASAPAVGPLLFGLMGLVGIVIGLAAGNWITTGGASGPAEAQAPPAIRAAAPQPSQSLSLPPPPSESTSAPMTASDPRMGQDPPAASPGSLSPGARAQQPAVLMPPPGDTPPPVHTLAPGMSVRVTLKLRFDAERGQMRLTANQGALYGADAVPIPAGEPLTVPVGALWPAAARSGPGELRFEAGDTAAATVAGDDLRRLLRGETVELRDLPPAGYRAVWRQPDSPPAPLFTVRVASL